MNAKGFIYEAKQHAICSSFLKLAYGSLSLKLNHFLLSRHTVYLILL